ncbi:tryptophanyl-tRNA synthetase [Thecamonas trahens ATCC 50062]|uniref:tryptophan--tRNA ligase n=1 Tax=Thecamonas trahens ATCC 50062 TaxID=461836 RepID=A0A0L0DHV8_THETB|nr:tryptophanyl-tRNA synthetase [Thecamonas trahens ATCC 50062]KNC51815.1 tryptophanyl-tRNA synthetase [Thecamonas trahens ATCC 50062]|eukprot:XP_013755681.1 tryptophanyl-tRNA synthetase [Thecamonas trahens ATCC 50062]
MAGPAWPALAGKAGKAAGVGDAVGAHIIQTPRYVLDKADVVFSGIQPTGVLHLGNYLGAVATWLRLQEQIGAEAAVGVKAGVQAPMVVSVVDSHAMTTLAGSGVALAECSRATAASLLAAGIDPDRTVLYVQSEVQEHTTLAWMLGAVTPEAWLRRMTQYKDKTAAGAASALGLFSYPVLQAADILLYGANLVPVGHDQVQHIELARDIAAKFNAAFGTKLAPPRVLLNPRAPRIMSLHDGTVKMSKSHPLERSRITLEDTRDSIAAKIRRAATDSIVGMSYDEEARPNVSALLRLYAALTGDELEDAVGKVADFNASQFKEALTAAAIEVVEPIALERERLLADPAHIDKVLADGAARARSMAQPRLDALRQAMLQL